MDEISVQISPQVLESSTKKGYSVEFRNICKVVDKIIPADHSNANFVKKWVSKIPFIAYGKTATERSQVLFDLTGTVDSGQLICCMGPSGSGKTSLISILAGRNIYQQGTVSINGQKLNKKMKRKIAYVLQDDIFLNITVREQLKFTALLKCPKTMSKVDKLARVEQVIDTLSLRKCADTLINLVSGGERKRVNIATELLMDPALMYLDEPTSGLDSTSAFKLVTLLRDLSKNHGKTMIVSLHQPSSQIFEKFDKLLLLADGHCVYFGPPMDIVPYFSNLGFTCPIHYNPADYLMDLLADNASKDILLKAYHPEESKLHLDQDFTPIEYTDWPTSFFSQVGILFNRTIVCKRGEIITWLNFLNAVIIALISGLIWYRMPTTTEYVTERNGLIFFIITFWPLTAVFDGILAFPAERAVLNKERASGSYRVSAYFLAKTLAELPLTIILPVVYLIICYWMANLNASAESFFGFVIVLLLVVACGESMGLYVGTAVFNLQQALVFGTIMSLGLLLLGGFYAEHLRPFFSWAKFLSPFKYAFAATQTLEFNNVVYTCESSATITSKLPSCVNNSGYTNGNEILTALGVDTRLWFNCIVLLIMYAAFRFAAYLNLRFIKFGVDRV